MPSRAFAIAVLALSLTASTGCVSGYFVHYVTTPLDLNLDETPAHAGRRGTSQKRVVVPYPVRLQVDWGSTAIGDGMRAAGLTRVHYADLETLSILGLWTQRWIHLYGE